MSLWTVRYKGEERQRWSLTQPTLWPLKMTVKWLTYLTYAIMRKVCFGPISPHAAVAKLWTGWLFTHLARSEKQLQTDCRVLAGSGFLRLSFVFPLSHAHTHLKRHYERARICNRYTNITQRRIQTNIDRDRTHKHPHAQLNGLKSGICTHITPTITHTWPHITHMHIPCALAGMRGSCIAHKLEAAPSCKFFPLDNWAFS